MSRENYAALNQRRASFAIFAEAAQEEFSSHQVAQRNLLRPILSLNFSQISRSLLGRRVFQRLWPRALFQNFSYLGIRHSSFKLSVSGEPIWSRRALWVSASWNSNYRHSKQGLAFTSAIRHLEIQKRLERDLAIPSGF